MVAKDTLNPKDAAAIQDGVRIQGFLPYLAHEVELLEEACKMRADQMQLKGELTPQIALDLWTELLAYRRILRRMETKTRVGVSVAEANSPKMNLGRK